MEFPLKLRVFNVRILPKLLDTFALKGAGFSGYRVSSDRELAQLRVESIPDVVEAFSSVRQGERTRMAERAHVKILVRPPPLAPCPVSPRIARQISACIPTLSAPAVQLLDFYVT